MQIRTKWMKSMLSENATLNIVHSVISFSVTLSYSLSFSPAFPLSHTPAKCCNENSTMFAHVNLDDSNVCIRIGCFSCSLCFPCLMALIQVGPSLKRKRCLFFTCSNYFCYHLLRFTSFIRPFIWLFLLSQQRKLDREYSIIKWMKSIIHNILWFFFSPYSKKISAKSTIFITLAERWNSRREKKSWKKKIHSISIWSVELFQFLCSFS